MGAREMALIGLFCLVAVWIGSESAEGNVVSRANGCEVRPALGIKIVDPTGNLENTDVIFEYVNIRLVDLRSHRQDTSCDLIRENYRVRYRNFSRKTRLSCRAILPRSRYVKLPKSSLRPKSWRMPEVLHWYGDSAGLPDSERQLGSIYADPGAISGIQYGHIIPVSDVGGVSRLLERAIKYDSLGQRKSGSDEHANYRKPLAGRLLVLVSGFLFFGSVKLISYGVQHADYLYVVFVLLAFPIFLAGFAVLLFFVALLFPDVGFPTAKDLG